ncbi:DUF4352 domain-containing protein [Nocardia camponoti]|uniref:Mpr protein n=1 Tax=Nocardia camponoti TaxID=1616106 RepID=A0A917QKC4_9NOCA|nr:DUF4352 domain-containing protein [Nocardia camponoti]GGK53431.1 Mpr protein [Nocardia camponoti]
MNAPGYPPQPFPAQSPPPRKKNNAKVLILVIVGIFVLCGFGGCVSALSGGSDAKNAPTSPSSSTRTTEARATAPKGPVIAPAGSAVRDGKFEFTVTGVDPGVKTIGTNQFLQKTAQGEYVQVHLRVTNTSDKAQSYWSANQKLIDDQGRTFENDTMAGVNVNDSTAMTAKINPGNSVEVIVVFDVPAGSNPTAVELHDSAFSTGAKVAL